MSGAHARPSRPGRAVFALAALALTPPTVVLAPRAVAAAPIPASVPDTTPETQAGGHVDRAVQHSDRYGARPHLARRSAP